MYRTTLTWHVLVPIHLQVDTARAWGRGETLQSDPVWTVEKWCVTELPAMH